MLPIPSNPSRGIESLSHRAIDPFLSVRHEIQRPDNELLKLLALDHGVDHAVSQKELGALEPFGQLFLNGLLDHPGPSEPYQCSGLCYVDISKHCEARGYAARCWVAQNGNVRQPRVIQPGKSSRNLCHLKERNSALLHTSASR